MSQVDSIETCREFDDRYPRRTSAQQEQIAKAFSDRTTYEVQARFYAIWDLLGQTQAASEVVVQTELLGMSVEAQAIGDWGAEFSDR